MRNMVINSTQKKVFVVSDEANVEYLTAIATVRPEKDNMDDIYESTAFPLSTLGT